MHFLKGMWFALLLGTLLAAVGVDPARGAEDRYVLPWIRLFPEKPADMESNQCLIETYSYYTTYKKSENDLAAFGAIFKMDIGSGWEVRTFGDLLSWQYPSVGLGDISVGTKWNFLKGVTSAAVALDLEMPSGGEAFREPGFEPTLSFMASRKFGPFEPGCTLSSTYTAGGSGKNYYFSYQASFGLDYTPNEHHSIGVFAAGYTPGSASDHGPRLCRRAPVIPSIETTATPTVSPSPKAFPNAARTGPWVCPTTTTSISVLFSGANAPFRMEANSDGI